MIISLLGYMGSGKSHISKILSKKINFNLIDLDQKISEQEGCSIAEIFENKGELYFRKLEKKILEEILNTEENIILSVGGGTPVYYQNIDTLNAKSSTIFLRASVGTLTERINKQKQKRPLVANISEEDLPEFIAKHLFERNPFYHQAKHIVSTDGKSPDEIMNEIISILDLHQ